MSVKDTIISILKESNDLAGKLTNDTEGNFKPADMEAIWFDGYAAIYRAGYKQAIKDIKQGKWEGK